MTNHLSSEEFIAALDRTLPPARAAHADECKPCRAALAEIREVVGHLHSTEGMPEPSPLFWDHLSERVRAATVAEPATPESSWLAAWRPFVAFGAAAAALALVVVLRTPPVAPAGTRDVASTQSDVMVAADDDASWNEVAQLASTLSADDVHLVVASVPEAAATVSELTPAERQAFVDLLKVEMGGRE